MFGFDPCWFIGVVEDRNDPLKIGRCRVRCLGYHQQDIAELPTENLPWAQLLLPSNTQNEIKPPKEGSWVFGFFKDGKKYQEPMIMSLIPGIPIDSPEDKTEGFYDKGTDKKTRPFPPKELKYSVDGKKLEITEGESDYYPPKKEGYLKQVLDEPDTPRVSRNDTEEKYVNDKTKLPKDSHIDKVKEFRIGGEAYEKEGIEKALSEKTVGENSEYSKKEDIDRTSENAEEIDDGKKWKEKETKYKSVYPYNKVEQTESGHIFEIDDTKGSERIHQQHRSGTFYEIHPDGSKVEKVMADNFHITQQNEYKLNLGNYEVTIKKNKGERVEGDIFVHINGERSLKIDKDSHVEILGNDTYTTKGNREQTTVGNKDETVKGNRTEIVEKDHTETIKGNRTETVEKNHTETIKGQQTETFEKNKTEKVKGNRTENVDGSHSETIGGSKSENIGRSYSTSAASYSLSVTGSATANISGSSSTSVSGSHSTNASNVSINASQVTISGGIIKLN
jgi:hypothetical protein